MRAIRWIGVSALLAGIAAATVWNAPVALAASDLASQLRSIDGVVRSSAEFSLTGRTGPRLDVSAVGDTRMSETSWREAEALMRGALDADPLARVSRTAQLAIVIESATAAVDVRALDAPALEAEVENWLAATEAFEVPVNLNLSPSADPAFAYQRDLTLIRADDALASAIRWQAKGVPDGPPGVDTSWSGPWFSVVGTPTSQALAAVIAAAPPEAWWGEQPAMTHAQVIVDRALVFVSITPADLDSPSLDRRDLDLIHSLLESDAFNGDLPVMIDRSTAESAASIWIGDCPADLTVSEADRRLLAELTASGAQLPDAARAGHCASLG